MSCQTAFESTLKVIKQMRMNCISYVKLSFYRKLLVKKEIKGYLSFVLEMVSFVLKCSVGFCGLIHYILYIDKHFSDRCKVCKIWHR